MLKTPWDCGVWLVVSKAWVGRLLLFFQRQKFWKIYLTLRRVTDENALTESENGRPRLVVEAYGCVISNSLSLQASSLSLDSHQLHSRRGFVFRVRAKARISSE